MACETYSDPERPGDMPDEQVKVQGYMGRGSVIQLFQEICREGGCRDGVITSLTDSYIGKSGASGLYH